MPICGNCNANLPGPARFCRCCGATLGGTQVQGRTVVLPQQSLVTNLPQTARPLSGPEALGHSLFPTTLVPPAVQREHVVMLLDVSGSMGEAYDGRLTKLAAAVRAAGSLILEKNRLDPEDCVGVTVFTNVAQILAPVSPVGQCCQQLVQALQSLRPGGNTDINAGLKAARDQFNWFCSDVVCRIVLLTDGHGGNPLRTAEELKGNGVVIDVIGIGETPSNVDEKLLKHVASIVQGELAYRFIKDQRTLVEHYTRLAGKTLLGP